MKVEELNKSIYLLLSATFSIQKDGRSSHFFVQKPGQNSQIGGFVASVYWGKRELIVATLYIRLHGPLYLRDLSVSEIEEKLVKFIQDTYWLIIDEVWFPSFDCSYAERISEKKKVELAQAFDSCDILSPPLVLTLFPLVPIRVETSFNSKTFFFTQPAGLTPEFLGQKLHPQDLSPETFPPFHNWKGRIEHPNSWLGIRASTLSTAFKIRNAVLGAIALLPHYMERHLFSGRKMFGGRATLDDGWTISFGLEHTPALSEDVSIKSEDHAWLSVLEQKLYQRDNLSTKHVRSLEYFYRAWSLPPVERFPVFFMALDAVFGDASQATQAVVDAVSPIMGEEYGYARLKKLLSLRAAVVHGGAPDVYESNKYNSYYELYLSDPIRDLEVITARCISSVVFEGKLEERPHTHAALLEEKMGIKV